KRAKPAPEEPTEGGWRSDPDVLLMQKVKAGDIAAFRELFSKYHEAVVNFACRFVGGRPRAEGLPQEPFLQIYPRPRPYAPRARFTTFLYRVATNLCLNELRRFEYQGRTEPLEGKPTEDGEEGSRELSDDSLPSAEDRLAGVETGVRIQKVLDKLPPNQKSA